SLGTQRSGVLLCLGDDGLAALFRLALERLALAAQLGKSAVELGLAPPGAVDTVVEVVDLALHRVRLLPGRIELSLELLERERRPGHVKLDVAEAVAAEQGPPQLLGVERIAHSARMLAPGAGRGEPSLEE